MISGARIRAGRAQLIRWAAVMAALALQGAVAVFVSRCSNRGSAKQFPPRSKPMVAKTGPRKRADLKARALSKRMFLPFWTAIFLFFLVLICMTALRPTTKRQPIEVQGILTILR
jgi:hypothetical protein